MTTMWTIERQVHFRNAGHGRGKQVHEGPAPEQPPLPPGRVPRVTKLMALALHFDDLLRSGEIASYAELARLGHVTRARVCQILNLVYLAPDLQEALLFLPRTERGRDRVILADLQPIAATPDWRRQRRLWARLHST
jgi:hypothetical protein